jgi:prepilin-type N-terminal cleavage/methylation domain-containing protein
MPTIAKHYKGFTLIELMISIVIVAVLFGVVISSISGIRRNSRDAQRQADLRTIQSALQNFYADQNFFPNNTGSGASTDISTLPGITNCTGTTSCTISTTYLSSIPADPLSGASYKYQPLLDPLSSTYCSSSSGAGQCHYYILCAALEGSPPPNSGSSAKCSGLLGSTYNFQLNP